MEIDPNGSIQDLLKEGGEGAEEAMAGMGGMGGMMQDLAFSVSSFFRGVLMRGLKEGEGREGVLRGLVLICV